MQAELVLEKDADAARVDWGEVKELVRHWATGHGVFFRSSFALKKETMTVKLSLESGDLIAAMQDLYQSLFDRKVNFTMSMD
ncbi:MAG: hypothetical protein V1706_14205 [Pseudomonadota bacterium]